MWVMVILFTTNLFIDVVLFGVQQPQFEAWCIAKSRGGLANHLNTLVMEQEDDASVYNCTKLWEDELKFSVAVFIMIAICFIYWAACLWSYSQKMQYAIFRNTYEIPFHPGVAAPMHAAPGTVMHNIGKSDAVEIHKGRSLAEISRQVASYARSLFSSRKSSAPDPAVEKPTLPVQ
ncbi:hypothetical protein BX666DRAFT_2025584 [Dichotomocladium elegans]|nr:hypothetical protein BX666DRAFT_2025584 [Dichotomocladium elegans]